ncbi:glycosyl hydrolase family 95 catalytic domain-containing protein [Streptomyces djakartensis]|uniref:Lectin n=1 Tax=Streptomyces djakartensis TaxID=68193 RepID=A0ABQ2ZR65_9ACTN|nr:glycoside hydrolase N-terminal domain-containing protein [Streptomyces djakartensis]GGY20448.1 lectin [Streptomyces djakartensis]
MPLGQPRPGDVTAPAPLAIPVPERGIHDTAPAASWRDGFLTGSGEYGAVVYGGPALESVIFNYHRLVLPNGTREVTPPVLAGRLEAVRDKALAGDYAGANRDFAAGWELLWTQMYHPAYELRIADADEDADTDTDADTGGVGGYVRTTDFRTGEVTSAWADGRGTWTRRLFASRADRVIVHEMVPPPGATIDVTLSVHTALDDAPTAHGAGDDLHTRVDFATLATVADGSGWLNLRGTYPEGLGAYGYEGVTRVVPTGGTVGVSGAAVVVTGAERLTLLTRLDRYEEAGVWDGRPLHARLAALEADYRVLLERHSAIHTELYDRSRLDLRIPEADRRLPVSELLERQKAAPGVIDPALLERLYDSGRYLFLSSSGVLPPRLTGIWSGSWSSAWAGDFTTDANVNLQVAQGSMLDLTEVMEGYFGLVLGQLEHWRTNARNLYGARGYLAPSRTDGEYGHMLHFDNGDFPGHCWTGGADWLLQPLLEYYEITGDEEFLRDRLGPALMELALFYEDFLSRTDAHGKVVFVPSFSMENWPGDTGVCLSVNATGDISAGRHALTAAVQAADALGAEQGEGEGVERWTALLARLPDYAVNEDGALAEWSWDGLADRYDHRHIQHLYAAWPLHEINPEERPDLVAAALRALEMRGDQNLSAHGSLHRALVAARLKDGAGVYANLLKIIGNDMLHRSLMTSHNPGLDVYNADAANTLPAVLAEALLYSRPGVLELLPAWPEAWGRGTITGIRARGGIRVHSLEWDLSARSAVVTLTSDTAQDLTLISRRWTADVTVCADATASVDVATSADAVTSAEVVASPLGPHARRVALAAGRRTRITVSG